MGSYDPRNRDLLVGIVTGLLVVAQSAWGQRAANWRVYRVADGLPEAACISVTVGRHGRVLSRHPSQPVLTLLDGYSITRIPAPEANTRRIYQSPAGQIWTPTHKGLLELRDGSWMLHEISQIASRFAASPQRPMEMPIEVVRQGVVLFLLPDALMAFYAKDPGQPRTELIRAASASSLGEFRSFALARDGGLWVSGSKGLAKVAGSARSLRPESPWQEFVPPSSMELVNFNEPCEYGDGSLTVLAESARTQQKVIAYFERQRWTVETPPLENVRFGWRGPNHVFWAVTPAGLFHWEHGATEITENEEISARQYFDVAVEPGGVFWLATSDGLYRYAPPAWTTPRGLGPGESLIHCLAGDRAERLWFIAANSLHSLYNEIHQEYPLPASLTRPPPQALYPLRNGALLMEAAGKLFAFQPESRNFDSVGDTNRQARILGTFREGAVCIQTQDPETPAGTQRLEVHDGTQMEPFPNAPDNATFREGFLSFFVAQNGDFWLGAESGTTWFHEDKWQTFLSADQNGPEAASGFSELGDGKIWCSARDRLWEFDGRSWAELPSSFDRINSFIHARDGSVWLASNSGCYRYFQGTWVENGIEEGLTSPAIREVYEDARGRIWAATGHGLSVYHPEADPDPPKAYVQELRGNERDLPEGTTVNLTFSGIDKWKFTARERLLYSHRLDQREWSEFTDITHVSFSDLVAGKHYFQVRAMDRNCNVEPNPCAA